MTVTRTAAVRRQWPTIGLELLVTVAALYGGVGLIWDLVADNAIGMTQDWLVGTPFTSWVLPGVFLLAVVAVPMGAAAALELRRSPWAAAASVVAGAAQVGWIAVQLAVMQRYFVLQPVMIGAGLAVLALALWAARHRPLVPHHALTNRRSGRSRTRCGTASCARSGPAVGARGACGARPGSAC